MVSEDDADKALDDLRRQLVAFVLEEAGRNLASNPKAALSSALLKAVDERVAARVESLRAPDAAAFAEQVLTLLRPELVAISKGIAERREIEDETPPRRVVERRLKPRSKSDQEPDVPRFRERWARAAGDLLGKDWLALIAVGLVVLMLAVAAGWFGRGTVTRPPDKAAATERTPTVAPSVPIDTSTTNPAPR